jgi:diguanylate cyclase (GGDEF)-like protein
MQQPCETCPFNLLSLEALEEPCNPLQMPVEQQQQLSREELTIALGCVSTRLVEAEQRAAVDPLTELDRYSEFQRKLAAVYNHEPRGSEVVIDSSGEAHRPLLAIAADGNKFGKINKAHGHDQGDKVLEAIAGPFRNLLLQNGRLAARRGGDEFVAAAFGLDYPEAADLCAEFTAVLAEGQAVEMREGFLVVTLGVAAVYGANVTSYEQAQELFRTADEFLVTSKETTRAALERASMKATFWHRISSPVRAVSGRLHSLTRAA